MINTKKQHIIRYAENSYRIHVSDAVPPAMSDGEIDSEGWVTWKVIDSSVSEADLNAIEREFGFTLPPYFAGYLRACCHLLDQVHCRSFDEQQVLMPSCPSDAPLAKLHQTLTALQPLINARYVPFAEWGDGWGPVCMDVTTSSNETDDYPIVWFDHEEILPMGEDGCAQPLFPSFKAMFMEIYGDSASTTDVTHCR